MSIVELLSIYGTTWYCWNNNLLSEAERNEGIKEKYYMKNS
jgi:hypothetical protein